MSLSDALDMSMATRRDYGDDAPMDDNEPAEETRPVVNDEEQNEDEEGEPTEGGPKISDDSSEEEEEDEEELRKITEGFIVEDEEEEEDEEEVRRKRKKRRKHKHRRRERDPEEDLDDEDLELLEENTGGRVGRSRHLTRLRRGRDSESPDEGTSSRRKNLVESSDDDLDENNIIDSRVIQDIQNIWNDERAGGRDDDEDADMDDFIDDEEDEEEGAGAMAEEEREERRRERRRLEKERRRVLRSHPELTGIDANAWDEINDVFGDGHDYDWALVEDEEEGYDEASKPEMKYQDVFEPSEIKARLLTEDDDLIRAQDVPERMQLATSTLSSNATLSFAEPLTPTECSEGASWVTVRLGGLKEREFFRNDGRFHYLLQDLVQAVTHVLDFLFRQNFEVPYIWTHRRDFLTYWNPNEPRVRVELLSQKDLWRIYALGQKYRSLIQRQKALQKIYNRLGVRDQYYEGRLKSSIETVEGVADITHWLGLKYKTKKQKEVGDFAFHDDDEQQVEVKTHKLPSRTSAYEVAKKTIVSKLAEGYGLQPHEVVINFMSLLKGGSNENFVEDQDVSPIAYANQFVDPEPSKAVSPKELLRQARMIIATELGADPLLRQHVRDQFKAYAQVSILPTERGRQKIDEYHSYFNFKYLLNKPIHEMLQSTQFLNILAAEAEHLVTVSIFLPKDVSQEIVHRLTEAFASDNYSDAAKAWNDERSLIVQEVVEKQLLPLGVKWTREYVREEVEDYLANRCAESLTYRINVAPYNTIDMEDGETASVLAVSWGKGDPRKDEVTCIFLDDAGRLREHISLDNLTDDKFKEEFRDLVKRRNPHVVVLGGFSITTTKLAQQIKTMVGKSREEETNLFSVWGNERLNQNVGVPVIYMHDEVARIYQHSKRAQDEFPFLSLIGKYCVGLARYTQSPLNEFAALGTDLTAITFDDEAQPLVPREKLLWALERALVDVVNRVGVDINRAVNEPYYSYLLPYVAGLGPRKAQAMIKKILSLGGHLVNREQFIKSGVLTSQIFLNSAGFLRITQDPEYKEAKGRGGAHTDFSNLPDPLDDTRIHPEDYELARKMAIDTLGMDEEDIHDEHPSHVINDLMKDPDYAKKLDDLNLDQFAKDMYEINQDLKWSTLNLVKAELVKPFGEQRPTFVLPDAWDIVTMLTGETQRTLRVGLIVSVSCLSVRDNFALVKMDSGIEGIINAKYFSDDGIPHWKKGQTLPGVIIDVKMDPKNDLFSVELSSRQSDVSQGDKQFRRVKADEHWNVAEAARDLDLLQRKKRAEVNKGSRVVKHPNFHNFNSSQAEVFLEKQQAGDVVIRPSSKGSDHLAVTWKVADGLYQHIDVLELNADPAGQGISSQLVVDGKYEYSDLDELLVNHVKAMSRRVEDLMGHDKFKKDDDELQKFLIDFVKANPTKSIYGFTLNRKRPGHFNLSFLAKKGSSIQTWPVRVMPEAYYLFDAAAAGVSELCDAFKVRYLHEWQNNTTGAGGSKTPYGAGRMTPARTPGYATPGHMSVRRPAVTPNPYSGPTPTYGGQSAYAQPASHGYQTPSVFASASPAGFPPQRPPQPPPNMGPPPGMHPGRAAMIQQSETNGWVPGGGGRW